MYKFTNNKDFYKFNRLPFGVKVTPGIFQQIMDASLGDLDFAQAYLDDILIKSRNHEEHAKHVKLVLRQLNKRF